MAKGKKLQVKCPTCEEKFCYYDSEYRPFCSEKCRMVDLGQWFSESYAIPSRQPLEEEEMNQIEREWNQDGDGSNEENS